MRKRTAQRSAKDTLRPANRRKKGKLIPRTAGFGRYVLLVLVLAAMWKWALPAVTAGITANPVFTLRHIQVEGAAYLDPAGLEKVAGIETGGNIFHTDLAGAATKLTSSFAAERFTVYRKLPDTVVIRVHERTPVALVNADRLIGVDREGVPLPHIGASNVETLPIISGVQTVRALEDSTVRAHVLAGIDLLDRVSKQSPSVYKRISEVNVAEVSRMGITLVDNGLEVIVGDTNWDAIIPSLEGVVYRVTRQVDSLRVVDLRFGEKIFVRKR